MRRVRTRAGTVCAGALCATSVLVSGLVTGSAAASGSHLAAPSGPETPTDVSDPTGAPQPTSGRVPGAGVVVAGPVLDPLDPAAAAPAPPALAASLAGPLAARALGPDVSVDVVDAGTGRRLLGVRQGTPQVPASTLKILTGAAALAEYGPGHTLTTSVVTGATAGEVVLVGGGDVLLADGAGTASAVEGHAGLADLAARTAQALRAGGRTGPVAVRLDDSLFSGPAVAPGPGAADVAAGFVAPVSALAVDGGRRAPGEYAPRHADPGAAAAQAFARRLAAAGVPVSGVSRGRAPATATTLASVSSAALGDVVEHMLTTSDNTVAEVLARLVARAQGRPGSFGEAGSAVHRTLARLGVPVAGTRLTGGSGLARGDVVPAQTITATLVLAASDEHPELRPVLTGLPVAAVTGTLSDRFDRGAASAARGLVRAKTGSLSGVNGLAGVVVDADGRLLAFAVLADRTGATPAARAALDAVAGTLAACGCR